MGADCPASSTRELSKKHPPVKDSGAQVILQAIFHDPFDPGQGVGDVSHALKDDLLPNPDAFFIDRQPDFLLVAEMTVKPALGDPGGFHNAINGSIEVALDGKELHGFFQDMLAGQVSFGSHPQASLINKPTIRYFIILKRPPCQPCLRMLNAEGQ